MNQNEIDFLKSLVTPVIVDAWNQGRKFQEPTSLYPALIDQLSNDCVSLFAGFLVGSVQPNKEN